MEHLHTTGHVLGKIAFFALVGLMTLILAGPVIGIAAALFSVAVALLSVLLPFALVGLLVWLPIQFLTHGPEAAWRGFRDFTAGLGRAVKPTLRWAFVDIPVGAGRLVKAAWHKARAGAGAFGLVFLEAAAGGTVGGLLGSIGYRNDPFPELSIPLGIACGAGIGILIGTSRRKTRADALPEVVRA